MDLWALLLEDLRQENDLSENFDTSLSNITRPNAKNLEKTLRI